MKNMVQDGRVLTFTAPYQRNAGDAAKIGMILGVAVNTVANATPGEFAVEGVYTLPKTAGQALTEGQKVYWDDAAKSITGVATSNLPAGIACAAAAGGDASAVVKINCAPPALGA
jgi:predicted RecA/RadA family phage recombinase